MDHTPTEYQEQCAVIKWARLMADTVEPRLALLHGDMGGVRLGIGAAVKSKRAGVVKGWPDLFLPVRSKCGGDESGPTPGLFIELKRRKNWVLSPEQKNVHAMLREQGYRVEVCCGADEAIEAIGRYLDGSTPAAV